MKNAIRAVALVSLVASPVFALADNCGNKDRAALPSCVTIAPVAGGYPVVKNSCGYAVTVKYDRKNGQPDSRRNLNPDESINNEKAADYYWCCPKYNRCQ